MSKARRRWRERAKHFLTLNLLVTLAIFLLLLLNTALVLGVVMLLIHLNVLSFGTARLAVHRVILYILLTSVVLGGALSALISRIPLKPAYQVIDAMNRLANGDFKTRLQFGRWLGRHPAMRELSDSVNKMAEELENTELLRSDFINNFSHEFKTPIVSIAGFAALLKRNSLSQEEKDEYIQVIEEESLRLSDMATNVLNLSRVENQTILRDVTEFNLSEQIRDCVLLLENRWSAKHLDMNLDLDERRITANEELLKQVWINLIDNAVKFTPEYGLVSIDIKERDGQIDVTVLNTGSAIPKESMERIFQKFYQADTSHTTRGNGVGLAIVKKVVDLHGGTVSVTSRTDRTAFTVTLPADAPRGRSSGCSFVSV